MTRGIDTRSAVGLAVTHARREAGSVDALAAVIKQDTDEDKEASTLYAWGRGENPTPAHILFALARRYNFSLDEFNMGYDLRTQIAELRRRLELVESRLNMLLADAGKPLLDQPMPRERTRRRRTGTGD